MPARLLTKASFVPSRDRFTIQASIAGEVTTWPAPTILPRLASNESNHPRMCCDPAVKAMFFPSGERAGSVSSPGPVKTAFAARP
jgi:hypothetical protein